MSAHDTIEPTRRDFLYIATGMAGVVGAAAVAWPFIDQMRPDASTLALSSIEVDVSSLQPGMSLTVKWRGKPVFIRNRTPEEIEAAKAVPLADLKDPVARNANLPATHRRPTPTVGRRGQGELADHGRRLHPSRLHPARPAGRVRRLVLPVPRLALRYRRPHPQRPGAGEHGGAGFHFTSDTTVRIG